MTFTRWEDLSPFAQSLIPMGDDDHVGYSTAGHHDDAVMLQATSDMDDHIAGEPCGPYEFVRGYGHWNDVRGGMVLDWSNEPKDGYEPMTYALVAA